MTLRRAIAGDAAAVGALHVASWRETYAGILPDEMLAALSADDRAAMWGAILDDPAAFGDAAVFVADGESGIVGFGACGGQRDQALTEAGYTAEIAAIYTLRSHQRKGVGRALMRAMAAALVDRGHAAATLWVLRENVSARSFYERLGGDVVGEKATAQGGATLTELAYGWRDLASLIR